MWGSGNPKINAYEPLNYLFLQDLGFTTDLPGPLEILCLLGSLAQNCLLVLGKYVVGSVFFLPLVSREWRNGVQL